MFFEKFFSSFAVMLISLSILTTGARAEGEEGKKVEVNLVSGEKIRGSLSSIRDGNVVIITEFGVNRIPIEKLTAETKSKLGLDENHGAQQLQTRVTELEHLVERLRAENQALRKKLLENQPTPPSTTPQGIMGGGGKEPRATQPAAGGSHWISSSGKRHNSRCRYFRNSQGRSGSATEGTACKICGG